MDLRSLKWLQSSVPKAPKKPGLLMGIYYWWQEYFTSAGRSLASLFFLGIFAGLVPGFWAAWIFCGIDFLLFLGVILSLFVSCKRSRIMVQGVAAPPVFEGEVATISATVLSPKRLDFVQLGAYRLNPSLKLLEAESTSIEAKDSPKKLQCCLKTNRRGSFMLNKVAANVPEIMGVLCWPYPFKGSVEFLVYPRIFKVESFSFLTSGARGMAFAALLTPSLNRGMNFIGVRPYRDGDSLRDLHHRAFARYGKPFTMEFETERGAGVVLYLDTAQPSFASKCYLEEAIRVAAGVGLWLQARRILGRFFINDEEIPLSDGNEGRKDFLDALARIPSASVTRGPKPSPWKPAARPMDPVLRVGLYAAEDSLVQKHIVVGKSESLKSDEGVEGISDKFLWVSPKSAQGSGGYL